MTRTPITRKRHPSDMQDRIIIRLPDGLHEKLKTAAEDTRQTMTQLAVTLIEQGLSRYRSDSDQRTLIQMNADETIGALNEVIEQAQAAKNAFQALLLAQKKPE